MPSTAGHLTLVWDPNQEPDLAGYKLYYTEEGSLEEQSVDVGNVTEYKLAGLTTGKFYLVEASAYDTSGNESDKSYGLRARSKFDPVTGLRILE